MIDDTLEFVSVEATEEKPEILVDVSVQAESDEDMACAKCKGECKVY